MIFPVPGDGVRTPVVDADRAADSRAFVRRREEVGGRWPECLSECGYG